MLDTISQADVYRWLERCRVRTYAVHVPKEDLEKIHSLVRDGFFANRSEFVRTAIRELLQKEMAQIADEPD
jgi:Arc/MetJ-type ribon-helix-helix transcriptional regulator